jgi:hypothetical protein
VLRFIVFLLKSYVDTAAPAKGKRDTIPRKVIQFLHDLENVPKMPKRPVFTIKGTHQKYLGYHQAKIV